VKAGRIENIDHQIDIYYKTIEDLKKDY